MSASGDGTRGPPKSKGKTLSSFFGSLPGFSSARNLVSHRHSPTKDVGPVPDPTGTPVPPSPVATDLQQTARGAEGLLQSQQTTAGNKDVRSSSVTTGKDAFSSGVAGIIDMAKGMVQGGLGATQSALVGTKEAVSGGVTEAVGMAKGLVQGGLDTSKTVLSTTRDTVTTGLTGSASMAKGTVQTGLDTSKKVLTGTKDMVTTGLTGAINVAKGAAQGGLDTAKSVVMGTKDTVTTGLTGAVNMAKGTVQTGLDTTKSVVMGTKDTVTTGLTGAVNVAKVAAQGGLDTTKSVVMGTKDMVTTGLTGAMNVAKGTVQTGLDSSKSVLTGTKDTVCAGVTGAINVAKGAAEGGLDTSKAVLTGTKTTMLAGLSGTMNMATETMKTGLDTSKSMLTATKSEEEYGQLAVTSFAALHDELEGLGDIFQPMTAEEQAQLAASESGPRVFSADQGSYFVRLGDLAPSFRQRAFEHALSHIQHKQFQARATLAQLQKAFQVTDMTMEAPGGQLCGNQSLGSTAEAAGTHEVCASRAQDRLCTLICQLHAAYSGLAASLQGLPEVQQQAGLARHSLCKLYGLVSSDSSGELQAEQLAQSSAGVVQAWQGLEVLLDRLQQSPPLSWLVGPFALMPGDQL